MMTRGIVALLTLAACAAAAIDVAVGPAVIYGTPVEERALAAIMLGYHEVWEINRDFVYGLGGGTAFAPFEVTAGAGYFSVADGRQDRFTVEELNEAGWRATADVKYIHDAPPLNAALRAEYGRAEINYDMGPAPGTPTYETATARYICDLYSLAATLGPRLTPWDWLQADLAVGPGLKIVRRNGDSSVRQKYRGSSTNPIGYENRFVELHYVAEVLFPLAGRFGLRASAAGISKMAELRGQYPYDDDNRFWAALNPTFSF
jgi:hypothetical protein